MEPFFIMEMISNNNNNNLNSEQTDLIQYNSPENNFLTIFFIIASCIYFSTTIVSLWYNEFDDADIDSYYNDIENYKLAYFDEFKTLEEIDHTNDFLKQLSNTYIKEETPMGDIYMTYNVDYHSFWYYADRQSIPYGILDTVARKFAINNNCKSICINYQEECDKAQQKYDKEIEETPITDTLDNEEPQLKPKNMVFATLKSYNKNKKDDKTKKFVLVDKANRFTFKGFTRDWVDPKTIPNNDRENKIKKLNFETFKREHLINRH